MTLCVDDDLASGSWRYDTVRLHVTRKPGEGDTHTIGLAGEADCAVKQRLSAVGQVNRIMRTNDNSANALNYDITWPASADAKGENIYPVRGKARRRKVDAACQLAGHHEKQLHR